MPLFSWTPPVATQQNSAADGCAASAVLGSVATIGFEVPKSGIEELLETGPGGAVGAGDMLRGRLFHKVQNEGGVYVLAPAPGGATQPTKFGEALIEGVPLGVPVTPPFPYEERSPGCAMGMDDDVELVESAATTPTVKARVSAAVSMIVDEVCACIPVVIFLNCAMLCETISGALPLTSRRGINW